MREAHYFQAISCHYLELFFCNEKLVLRLPNLLLHVCSNQREWKVAVDQQTCALKTIDELKNLQQLSSLIKGWQLVLSLNVSSRDAVSCVPRCLSNTFLDDFLHQGCLDRRRGVWRSKSGDLSILISTLFSVCRSSASLSVSNTYAIATITRKVTEIFAVEAFNRTLFVLLSELEVTARVAWLWPVGASFIRTTLTLTAVVVNPCLRLLMTAWSEPFRASAWPRILQAQAGDRSVRCRESGMGACDPYCWLREAGVMCSLGKGLEALVNSMPPWKLVV